VERTVKQHTPQTSPTPKQRLSLMPHNTYHTSKGFSSELYPGHYTWATWRILFRSFNFPIRTLLTPGSAGLPRPVLSLLRILPTTRPLTQTDPCGPSTMPTHVLASKRSIGTYLYAHSHELSQPSLKLAYNSRRLGRSPSHSTTNSPRHRSHRSGRDHSTSTRSPNGTLTSCTLTSQRNACCITWSESI
jgi:hypothetical protein